MARYIDADKLLEDMQNCCSPTQFGRATAKMCVKKMPTEDVEKVVHCADCKYKDSSSCPVSKYYNNCGASFYKSPIVLTYCSYGKPKSAEK